MAIKPLLRRLSKTSAINRRDHIIDVREVFARERPGRPKFATDYKT
ncbi:hypothetical protein ACVJBD_005531 [Rhizobium mongolense]